MPRIEDPTLEIQQADLSRDRYRRSNPGGDDLPTKIVFALIALGLIVWLARFWFLGHTHAVVTHL